MFALKMVLLGLMVVLKLAPMRVIIFKLRRLRAFPTMGILLMIINLVPLNILLGVWKVILQALCVII